jgi:hypothetical protein
MKIEKLIRIFEQCIPVYQKAVDEKWDYDQLYRNNMESGLCLFIGKGPFSRKYSIISNVFRTHYKNLLQNDYLFIPAEKVKIRKKINMSIKPRLEFLKQQVKQLKKLQKQGYTHV